MKKEIQVEIFGAESKVFDIRGRCTGESLFNLVCDDLDIHEREYFGIFVLLKNDQRKWIRHHKELRRQLKEPWVVKFGVKLYPPEPSDLVEELTRYYLYRQIRDDIAKGRLLASFVTHSLLGALAAQAELGDAAKNYSTVDVNNLLSLRLAPNVSSSLLERISELYIAQRGMDTQASEMKYLETCSNLPLYGLHQFHVRDAEKVDITLGVHYGGIYIFEKGILLNRLSWPAIIELSYKRDLFFVKVRAGSVMNTDAKIGFVCPSSGMAKRIWRIGVEQHHFFRKELSDNQDVIKGRTQHELVQQVSQLTRRNTSSIRRARSIRSSRLFQSQDNIKDTKSETTDNSSVIIEGGIPLEVLKPVVKTNGQLASPESPDSSNLLSSNSLRSDAPPKPLRRSRLNLTINGAASESRLNSPKRSLSEKSSPMRTADISSPASVESQETDSGKVENHALLNTVEVKVELECHIQNDVASGVADLQKKLPEESRVSSMVDLNQNDPLMAEPRSLRSSESTSTIPRTLRKLNPEQRSRSLLQLRRSFMET